MSLYNLYHTSVFYSRMSLLLSNNINFVKRTGKQDSNFLFNFDLASCVDAIVKNNGIKEYGIVARIIRIHLIECR